MSISKVSKDLKSRLPSELVDALLVSYDEIKQNYFLERHGPSELNGGKFCEACVRIIQHETDNGNYIPIGTSVRNMIGVLRDFERIPTNQATESYRIHIPRVLITMYNIRNKRGVGHLGGDVNPNFADSTLLATCADWVMAELFRIYYQCTLDEAQSIVDSLVQRKLVLVYDIEDVKRVLLSTMSHKNQTLVLLASAYPEKVTVESLLIWIEPSNKSRYRNNVLRILHKDRLIEYDESGWCLILPTGLNYVETHYSEWLSKLN